LSTLFDLDTQPPGRVARRDAPLAGLASPPASGAPVITVIVHGNPAPQGSKRHVGRGILVESSKHVGPWRNAVRFDAATAVEHLGDRWPGALDGPLVLDMVFTTTRPKNHYRTGRNAHLLRDDAPARPASPPDLSKLARSTEDALKDAGVYVDDARIVEYGRLAKVYAGEDPDALASPGAVIRIYRLGGDHA
jgi:Holliday junction resolvase RusA-like endonuclease